MQGCGMRTAAVAAVVLGGMSVAGPAWARQNASQPVDKAHTDTLRSDHEALRMDLGTLRAAPVAPRVDQSVPRLRQMAPRADQNGLQQFDQNTARSDQNAGRVEPGMFEVDQPALPKVSKLRAVRVGAPAAKKGGRLPTLAELASERLFTCLADAPGAGQWLGIPGPAMAREVTVTDFRELRPRGGGSLGELVVGVPGSEAEGLTIWPGFDGPDGPGQMAWLSGPPFSMVRADR